MTEEQASGSGDEVRWLRTVGDAESRAHALLIGVPLDELGGVAGCLARMAGWLGSNYETVQHWGCASKAAISEAFDSMQADVRGGDRVLVYYAGHGLQVTQETEEGNEVVSTLTTMDARRDDLTPEQRFIIADELVAWLEALAERVGADELSTAAQLDSPTASHVSIVLDCCHAAGMPFAWPESKETQSELLAHIASWYERSTVPGQHSAGVSWVMAAGRDEVAGGRRSGEVGLFTHALVDMLTAHGEEPWWAVMDRVRARWDRKTQSPATSGPCDVVPRTGLRIARPRGWTPCARQGDVWIPEMAEASGWRAAQRVALTGSLALPPTVQGSVVEHEGTLGVRVEAGGADLLEEQEFAWAARRNLARTMAVELWGGDAECRARVRSGLEGKVSCVRELGSRSRNRPQKSPMGLALENSDVVVRDAWGEALARTSDDEVDTWLRWAETLAVVDGWLAVERTVPSWRDGHFDLRWGTWNGDDEAQWPRGNPRVTSDTPLWIEVVDRERGWPSHAGVFRIRADRGISILGGGLANGGATLTRDSPSLRVGTPRSPLRFGWPETASGTQRVEELVAVVSNRPLTFSLLSTAEPDDPGAPLADRQRRYRSSGAKITMLRRRFLLQK